MKYRELAGTGIRVSEVGFGVWTLSAGWWGDVSDEESVRLLRRARELGINYFDTADTYGSGKGETILADAFRDEREEVVLSTKIGYDFYNNTKRRGQQARPQDWSEDFLRFALEQSLKRLETDYVDFLQFHNVQMDAVENDALFELAEKFKAEGKVRSYGVAIGPAIGWREEGTRVMKIRDLDGMQIIHNLLEQDPGRDFIEAARETGTSIIVRVPHSSGLLEGKYTEETTFAKNDHRKHRPREWLINGLKKVEQLDFLTASGERTLGQAALKWVLSAPEVAATLPNIYGDEQLEEFAATSEVPDLTREELDRIQELYEDNFGLEASGSRLQASSKE